MGESRADAVLGDGDPAQDVVLAAVIFLVDGKLVLLQPCPTEDGAPRYDMRVLASQVEFFALMRDQLLLGQPDIHRNTLSSPADEPITDFEIPFGYLMALRCVFGLMFKKSYAMLNLILARIYHLLLTSPWIFILYQFY
jgi:hypothetical protein